MAEVSRFKDCNAIGRCFCMSTGTNSWHVDWHHHFGTSTDTLLACQRRQSSLACRREHLFACRRRQSCWHVDGDNPFGMSTVVLACRRVVSRHVHVYVYIWKWKCKFEFAVSSICICNSFCVNQSVYGNVHECVYVSKCPCKSTCVWTCSVYIYMYSYMYVCMQMYAKLKCTF